MPDLVGGNVVWNLDVDKGKLTTGLSSAKGEVEDFARSTENRFSGFAKSLSSSLKAAEADSQRFLGGITLLGAGIAGLAGFAIKSAGDMEMLRSSFNTLTGSVEEGGRLFKDLYDFAARTPFETPDLAKAAQTMLSFGIEAEDTMENLRILGDISLGNSEKLQGLSVAFSQVQSTGRLMGQDLLQMINQGFNPLTIIAEKTGKSMAQLKDEMADGAISADMVRDAMVTATSEGGLFFQGMEKGAQTLPGIFSTLTDTIQGTIRSVAGLSETGEIIEGGFADRVKDAMSGLITFLNENQGTIKAFFENTFGLIADTAPIIVGAIVGGIIPAIAGLGKAILLSPLLPWIAGFAAAGFAIQLIVDALGGWEQATIKVTEALQPLINAFTAHVLPSLQELWAAISTQLLPALSELWTAVGPVLGPVLKGLAVILGGVVLVALRVVIEMLTSVVVAVTDNIRKFNELVNFFRGLPGAISSALSGVKNAITQPFLDAWNSVRKIADDIRGSLNKISPFHRESPSLVDNVIKGVGIIKKQFATLDSISLPSVTGAVPSFESSFSSGTTDYEGGTTPVGAIPPVNVYIDQVNDNQDIDMIGREIGFKVSLLPK